jgi:hypothetical protein
MVNFAAKLYPNIAPMKSLVFIVMYGAAVPFNFTLYQAFNLLRYISEDTAFSEISVKALKNIKCCAITISGLYVLGLPLFHFIAKKVDPSIVLMGLIIIFALNGSVSKQDRKKRVWKCFSKLYFLYKINHNL